MALLTPQRHNRRAQHPAARARAIAHFRQVIETLNSQLAERFQVERNEARRVAGPCARLQARLTTRTLGPFLTCLLARRCTASRPLPSSSTKGCWRRREDT
jgi:hypothetical protein